MQTDPHYYAWLGWVVSWILFPLAAVSSFWRYKEKKKRSELVMGVIAIVMFLVKIVRHYY